MKRDDIIANKANLSWANLSEANLSRANLSRAYLSRANLFRADLSRAYLETAKYSIFQILLADWRELSDELTLECMRWDSTVCVNPERDMSLWVTDNVCPCAGENGTLRLINFNEKKSLWEPGKPTMSLRELWIAIAKEKDVKI